MQTRLLTAVVALLLFAGPAAAQSAPDNGELGINFWTPEPEISLQGTLFSSTLGLGSERFREYRVRAGSPAHKFRFSKLPIEYSGSDKVISTTVEFQGVTYPVSVPVSYQFKWDLYRFGYEWDFARFPYGFIGFVTEVKYNKVSASLAAQSIGTEATEVNPPVPTFGGIGRANLGQLLSVTGEFTALKLTRDEFRGKFYDFDLYGQVNLIRHLAVQAGYRSLDVDYLVDSDTGTLRFTGPYFGASIKF